MQGTAGGNILGGAGTILGGIQEKQVAGVEAQDLQINAGESVAAGQRGAAIAERQTALLKSRQTAAAGGSGAGGGDVGVQDIEADTARLGEYNAMSALYRGESVARGLRYQAAMTQFAGNQALTGSLIRGAGQIDTGLTQKGILPSGSGTGTIASGGDPSLFDRFAGQLPPWMQPSSAGGGDDIQDDD